MNKRKRKEERPSTEQQKQAARLLWEGERVGDIAKAVGVHRSTVWRWEQKRGFWREFKRIDRNWARRFAYRRKKEEAEREKRIKELEENMHKEAAKITGKPTKSFYKACDEYEKALLGGYSLSQCLELLFSDNPLKLRRRRR
jgi:transcriptional regulator with XRE-family HTH domain